MFLCMFDGRWFRCFSRALLLLLQAPRAVGLPLGSMKAAPCYNGLAFYFLGDLGGWTSDKKRFHGILAESS